MQLKYKALFQSKHIKFCIYKYTDTYYVRHESLKDPGFYLRVFYLAKCFSCLHMLKI